MQLHKRIPRSELRKRIRLEENSDQQTDANKTALMFQLERHYRKDIKELLAYDGRTSEELGRALTMPSKPKGLHAECIKGWRKRLNIPVPSWQNGYAVGGEE